MTSFFSMTILLVFGRFVGDWNVVVLDFVCKNKKIKNCCGFLECFKVKKQALILNVTNLEQKVMKVK